MGFLIGFGALLIPYLVGADDTCSTSSASDDESFSTLQVRQEHAEAIAFCNGCTSKTAKCLACRDYKHIEDYCREHPKTDGCHNENCEPPAEKFDLTHKGCPADNDRSTCVGQNIWYYTFEEAWAACGENSECGVVMKWTLDSFDKFFLRRHDDPDSPTTGAAAMLYECPKVCPVAEPRHGDHCPSEEGLECDYHPVACGAETIFGTTAYCTYGLWNFESRLVECPLPKPGYCPPPHETFNLPTKSCPEKVTNKSTCVAHNRKYRTFAAAWAACGANPECGIVTKWKDGAYYLRRLSDPDLEGRKGQGSMLYECGGCPAELPAVGEDCTPGLLCDYDAKDCNGFGGGYFSSFASCGPRGWVVSHPRCTTVIGLCLEPEHPIAVPVTPWVQTR